MGTLYVSTLPAGDLDDWPLRAQRRLPEVSLVIASDLFGARRALLGVPLAAPLVDASEVGSLVGALEAGDAMLLLDGEHAGPSGPADALIRAAVERGFPVVPLPGPVLPVTALVASGLPAASFVWLGRLPEEPTEQRDLLDSVAGEKRTLVLVTSRISPEFLGVLHSVLGVRPVSICAGAGIGSISWRGLLDPGATLPPLPDGPFALVIGGAAGKPTCWSEERLRSEIQACLAKGMSARQAAKQLAAPSGWLRREVYRLAVRAGVSSREPPCDTAAALPTPLCQEELDDDRPR